MKNLEKLVNLTYDNVSISKLNPTTYQISASLLGKRHHGHGRNINEAIEDVLDKMKRDVEMQIIHHQNEILKLKQAE